MTEAPPRSTGRVVGPVRAPLLVFEGTWTWYRRNWKATVFSSVGLPVLYLLAMGLGFGSQVRAGSVPGGLTYLAYLAPALLPTGAVQTAAGECTFPVLSSFEWTKLFLAITATPVTPAQVVFGWLLWVASRLLVSGVAVLAVAAALGAVTGPGILLSLVFGVLTGLAFGAPLIAFAASVDQSTATRSTWCSGSSWCRCRCSPARSSRSRSCPRGSGRSPGSRRCGTARNWPGRRNSATLRWGSALVHIGFLLALLAAGTWLACWRFRIRLA